MLGLEAGKGSQFIFTCILAALIIWMVWQSIKGKMPEIRRLPAVDSIDEIVARSVEMGRPVMMQIGERDLNSTQISETVAGLRTLRYVAKLCARMGAKLIVPMCQPVAMPIAREYVKEAYKLEKKEEEFDENSVRFLSPNPTAMNAAIIATMWREKIGGNIMIGHMSGATVTIVENAYRVGAMQLGGTSTPGNMPFLIALCDYGLIGEEIYALGAYVGEDPVASGCIGGQDWGKWIVIILLIIGSIMSQAGMDISQWLTW